MLPIFALNGRVFRKAFGYISPGLATTGAGPRGAVIGLHGKISCCPKQKVWSVLKSF